MPDYDWSIYDRDWGDWPPSKQGERLIEELKLHGDPIALAWFPPGSRPPPPRRRPVGIGVEVASAAGGGGAEVAEAGAEPGGGVGAAVDEAWAEAGVHIAEAGVGVTVADGGTGPAIGTLEDVGLPPEAGPRHELAVDHLELASVDVGLELGGEGSVGEP